MKTNNAVRRLLCALAIVLLSGVHVTASEAAASPSAETLAPVTVSGVRTAVGRNPVLAGTWNSNTPKTARASCGSNERVLSGGAWVTARGSDPSTHGNVVLQSLVPGINTYSATAVERPGGYSGDWDVTAYAICVPLSVADDLSIRLVNASRTGGRQLSPTEYVNDVAAPCQSGQRVTGGGGTLGGTAGGVSFQQVRPNQQGAYVFVQGVVDRNTTTPSPFAVTAYAICANPISGWHVVIDGTDYNPARVQDVQARCTNQQLIGGGLTKGDSRGSAHVEAMVPLRTGKTMRVIGGIPNSVPAYNWNLAAWAICVDQPDS
jgi:hypothetical protein